MDDVIPNEMHHTSNVQLLGDGGRISFVYSVTATTDDDINVQHDVGPGRVPAPAATSSLYDDWSSILSPYAIKSLRLIVASCHGLTSNNGEDDVIERLVAALPEDLRGFW
jgi:hypothetical protein